MVYLAAAHAALGRLPTQTTLVFERFFDESGGMQLVLHAPFGSRINRAWGLALRKRFCRKFNFELQAAATEDNIVLSLTASHSFDLAEVQRYLNSNNVRQILIETLLDAPMFATRWRWVASISLALPRFRGGRKRAPQLARMDAEDLIASVFPDQLACAENIVGAREIPDHPLVNQTIDDCLHEAMDIEGLEGVLRRLESGAITVKTCELTEPSPLALEVMAARPYAYLDDAPLEERRTQAVMGRRWLAPEDAADIGRLDPEAIARVRAEAWPEPRNADELHDSLVWLGFLTENEAAEWMTWLEDLAHQKRVARIVRPAATLWITAERLPHFQALWPTAEISPAITAPAILQRAWEPEAALVEIVRGRLEGVGPVTTEALAQELGMDAPTVESALLALQTEGFALRGRYSADATEDEWCDRRLLARIHRYTVKRLRAEIEPVPARDFLRFLLSWQKVAPDSRMEGVDALGPVLAQLEGFEIPTGAWESDVLSARIARYQPSWLDDLCRAGRVMWIRLKRRGEGTAAAPVRSTPITFVPRRQAAVWSTLSPPLDGAQAGHRAQAVLAYITAHGASFFEDLVAGTGLLRGEVEAGIAEAVGLGLVTADSFSGLRTLITPAEKRRKARTDMEDSGRWALARRGDATVPHAEAVEHAARTLLRRYGVVFWKLLEREAGWLPPWRELLGIYRKLEARGEIRGGRFVAGFAGEQYALPEAVGLLRDMRRKADTGELIAVSGADPLNLAGILTPGAKLPALTRNRLLYRDGIPVAWLAGGDIHYSEDIDETQQWEMRKALLRNAAHTPRLLDMSDRKPVTSSPTSDRRASYRDR
jgi:ATP-dependent Lhr-like helicase